MHNMLSYRVKSEQLVIVIYRSFSSDSENFPVDVRLSFLGGDKKGTVLQT